MKTQDQLWAEYERLKAEERWDEALELIAALEPISDEEWLRIWADAPQVDEPIPQLIRERINAFEDAQRPGGRRAG